MSITPPRRRAPAAARASAPPPRTAARGAPRQCRPRIVRAAWPLRCRRRCHGRPRASRRAGKLEGRRDRFGVRSEVGRPKALGGEFKGGRRYDRSRAGREQKREWRSGASRASHHGFTSSELRLVSWCGLWRVAPRTAQAQGVRAMHVFVAVPRGVGVQSRARPSRVIATSGQSEGTRNVS